MSRERDAMLVEACLRGERRAFDELVDHYEAPLFNAAFRITGSVDDAMDATQAAFVNAYEKLHTFDPTFRFFSWIYRIVVNQALNVVNRRRPETALDSRTPTDAQNPEKAYGKAEADDFLQQALMELPPQQRLAVVLKHLEGYSCREIGDLLGIPEKTVKSRLFSARQRLRVILTEKGFVP
jgi:RNA polymerase sigma-70 factor (ECF subfamily)